MKQLSSARELVVTASNSKAFIVAEDGTLQPLMIGQRIPAGAVVQIAEDGELQTEPVAPVRVAQHLTDLPSAGDEPAASASSDIEKLQKSILAGIDPTLDLEATAAGGAAAAATGDASGSGNGGFIVIDRTSDSTLATAGFDTSDETTTTTSAVSQPADAVSAAANTAPATSDIELTTNEDQPITGAIVATDGDGDSLSYTLNGSPANGAVILNADGTFTYTPAGDFNGSDRFTVTISDGQGGTTTSTVTIGVTPLNDAPTSADLSLTTTEEQAVSGAIVATDLDGDSLSYTMADGPANGAVTLNSNGTFTYTPAGDFNGSDRFTVTISDGQGGTTTSTVTIGVTPLNDAPTSADLSLTTAEEQAVSGAIVATDLDGDSLSYTMADGPANGAVTLNSNGTFTYTPAGDFNGSDSFTVTISDGQGGSTTSTVTIGVTPLNDAPTSADLSLTTAEEQAVSGAIVATDLDGDSLSYTMADGPANGAVTLNSNGTFTYTPAGDFNGSDRFTVTISDGQGGTTTSTVTIGVTPLNDAPTSADLSLTTAEEQPVMGAIVATDVDGDKLSYAMGTAPANGSVALNADGTFTYTPATDFHGDDSFTVTVSDGNGGSSLSTVTIGVGAVNDKPVSGDVSLSTDEDTAVNGAIVASDLDGDSLSYTVGTAPTNGSVTLNADGTFTYTPTTDFHGDDSFTVTVSDGNGGSSLSTVTIGVGAVNDKPVSGDVSLSTDEDTAVNGAIVASDLDGDSLSYTVGTAPTNGSVTLNADGTFTYTPATDFHGDDSFTVTISDGQGGTTTSTVTIGVTPLNDVPTSADLSLTTAEEQAVSGAIVATDLDGDSLSYTMADGPANGAVTLNSNGTFTYTPAGDFNGSDRFTVTISDGQGGSTTSTVTIGVTPLNDAPTSADLSLTTAEEQAVSGAIVATDLDGDSLSYTMADGPANGAVTLNSNGTFTYTPAGDFNGSDRFTVTISDGQGGTTTSTVTIGVTPLNDAPTSADLSLTTTEEQAVSGAIVATDLDGDSLSYTMADGPANGAVTLNSNGTFTYTPAGDFNGSDRFTVTISDGQGGTTTSTVTIGVTPLNDAPLAVVDDFTVAEDGSVTIDVLGNDSDVDGDVLTITEVNGHAIVDGGVGIEVANGIVSLAAGQLIFSPNSNYNGPAQFTYTLSDGTSSVIGSVSGTVTPVNDGASISGDVAGSLSEDVAVNALGQLTAAGSLTVSDVDSGEAAFRSPGSLSGTYGDFTFDPATGAWTYAATNSNPAIQALGATGQLTDTLTVTSADGTASQVITVTIHGSNDGASISGDVAGSLSEDVAVNALGQLTAAGSLTVSDVDSGEAAFRSPGSLSGTYGDFTFDPATGAWTYAATNSNPAIQALGATGQLTDTLTVTSADGTASQVITVTIHGSNDGASISGDVAGSLSEDVAVNALGQLTAAGSLTVSDVDSGEAAFRSPGSLSGAYGDFTFDPTTGAWTYAATNSNPAIQALGATGQLTDTLTVTSADGTASQVITVTIHGSNDGASISGDVAGSLSEDVAVNALGQLTAAGSLTVSDVDSGEAAFRSPGSLSGAYGDFTFDPTTGAWTYAATNSNPAIQALGATGQLTDTLTVTSADGTASQVITVTIHGSNDAPTSTNDTITIPEDMGNTSNRYTLQVDDFGSFNDQDTGDSLQVIRIDSLPANGTFYLNGVAITSAMVSAPGGVTIKVSDISAENLKFDPADNSDLDSSFKFSVSDGTNWSNTSYTTQLNITALADMPSLTVVASSLGGHALEPTGGVGGNGLTLNYYDNVVKLNTSNAVSTSVVEAALEATTPTTSTTTSNLGDKVDIPTFDAYSAKGLIYLEAGHTYTFTGHQDDTFRLEIGGEVLVNNGFNTYKDYSGAYKVTTSGYYTFEMFAYNGDYIGDFSVKVAVDTGTAVNLSTSNIPLFTGIDEVDQKGLQHGAQTIIGDGGYYAVEYNHGMAETAIALSPISSVLKDGDGSESLALKIGSIPAGAVLSDGIHSFTATTALGSIDISTWNSSSLKLTPPDGFAGQIQLTITATATESSNADHASTTSNLLVTVDATTGETTALLSTFTLVDSDDMGLSGEYYGYNQSGNANTSTESSGTNNSIIQPKDGLVGNLDDLRDVYSVINAKQDVATSSTGSILIGQTNPGKASASATDAVFVATTFDYGGIKNGGALANLGDGNPLLMTPGSAVTSGHLYTFLNDAGRRGDASSLVTTSGFGSSTDSIIRMLGSAYFEAGKYDFQISADDGFALYVDGKLVVEQYDQTAGSTKTNESSNINLPYIELSEGLHNIEVVYWDQGGSASFDLSYKLDSVKTWTAFNSNNLALFQDGEAPTLGSLDDLVKGTDGHWYIQTGVDYSAGSGSDTITGTDGKDIIYGNSGNDTLAGGGNNDVLDGGLGNDILVGGAGDDVLMGGLGNDTFKWVKGDAASPAVDHVTDFDVAHDVLDISDLLEGYSTGTTDVLKQYLSVGSTSDGSTMIEVHNSTTSSSPVVQTIVLDGMSYSELTGSGSSSASDVLNHLIVSHLLNIDK